MERIQLKRVLGAVLVLLMLTVAAAAAEAFRDSPIVIGRVMTSSKGALHTVNGYCPDWVELTNLSDETLSLKGWQLGKGLDPRGAFVLPDVQLAPKESLLLYCSKRLLSEETREVTTGFSLSSDGELLILYDAEGSYRQVLEVPQLPADGVYELDTGSGTYAVHTVSGGTTDETTVAFRSDGVYIAELMADNERTYVSARGDRPDWVLLHNGTDSQVELTGWTLTDKASVRDRWSFPEGTVIAAGGDLLVELSEDRTGFSLGADGETLLLGDASGAYVSSLSYTGLSADTVVRRAADGAVEVSERMSEAFSAAADKAVRSGELPKPDPNAAVPGLYLNEAAVSMPDSSDWIELVNESGQSIDLTGFGLSDDPSHPRKWVFPSGTVIPAGGYLLVKAVGDGAEEPGALCAGFALSASETECLTLCMPDGTILQRMLLRDLTQGMSYGRVSGCPDYRYFTEPTPGSPNAQRSYGNRAGRVHFSETGGIRTGAVTLTLSSPDGAEIRYTTDGTKPTAASPLYSGPITIAETTVVKAIAVPADGLESEVEGATYVIGETHGLYLVCVSGSTEELIGLDGVLNTGGRSVLPEVFAEVYTPEGERLIGQECRLKTHGMNTRAKSSYPQKAFRLTAKSAYGSSRFRASVFTGRDYTEYKSIVLRAAGQDNPKAFMRDPLLTALARYTDVFYQEHETAVVYVNGRYWGIYYIRERVDAYSIASFEQLKDPASVNLLDSSEAKVMQGSNEGWRRLEAFLKAADLTDASQLEQLESMCDVDNYLDYVMLLMFIGNRDLNNVRMYMSPEDGRWHWVLYDTDFAAVDASDDLNGWVSSDGMVGKMTKQSNLLFRRLMANGEVRRRFLTRFGQLLATGFSTESTLTDLETLYARLKPEMAAECARWDLSEENWERRVEELRTYLRKRPGYIIKGLTEIFSLSPDEVSLYFGEAQEKM